MVIGDGSPDEPQLTASNAEVIGNIETDRYETVEINGVVTSVSGSSTFVIRKIVFRLNSETEYLNKQGGATDPVAIVASSKLKVEGLTLDDGTVLATSITVRN